MNASAYLVSKPVSGFVHLTPLQIVPVPLLRVAPERNTSACTPGNSATGAPPSHPRAGRAHVFHPVHGPVLAGEEQ